MVENKKIKLTDEINELILEIIPEHKKLVVAEKQNIIGEFRLTKNVKNPAILLKIPTDVKQYLDKNDFFDVGVIEIPYPPPKTDSYKIVCLSSGLTNSYPLIFSK